MKADLLPSTLRLIAWEVTRSCNLDCSHCRAAARHGSYPGELTTEEGLNFLTGVSRLGKPVVILTGGEPLLRPDIYTLARFGTDQGLRMVLATNGTILDGKAVERISVSGIKRVSISIDGVDEESHDAFRRVPGAFARAMRGISALKDAGIEFQINTTITKTNLNQIAGILDLAVRLEAEAHHIFLLVPTGRGRELADQSISAQRYEETLHWFQEATLTCPIQVKATCAPHYFRILHQKKDRRLRESASPLHGLTRGCMGGSSFCFISHTGQAQPCGYLEIDCGQLQNEDFPEIWQNSKIFNDLRNLDLYRGKCGRCEFLKVCGGCRARAYEATGDYLAQEPCCIYEPGKTRGDEGAGVSTAPRNGQPS